MAKRGTKIVMSSANKAYLDLKYDKDAPIGLHWAGYISIENSYKWDPELMIEGLNAKNTKRSQFFAMPYHFEGTFYNGADFIDGGVEPATSVISANWKLIYFFSDERFELYNLADDMSEQHNLIAQQPAQAERLVALLDKKMKQHNFNDIMPKRSVDGSDINWPEQAYQQFIDAKS